MVINGKTYSEMTGNPLVAQVFPRVVMTTPAILMKTATTLVMVMDSCPTRAPNSRAKRPDVEFKMVAVATLVFARAEFEKYCESLKQIYQSDIADK